MLSVSASDIVEGINNAQNNEQPVAYSSTIQPIASSSTAVVENLKIERINFSDIKDFSQKIENAKDKELFITGKELRAKKENLKKLLDQNPDILVTLDVSSGGFVNEKGALNLSADHKDFYDELVTGDLQLIFTISK